MSLDLCIFVYILLNNLFCNSLGVFVKHEYRFLPRSQLHNQTESPKILFRRFNSSSNTYLYIAYVNRISQLNPDSLSPLNERIIGPKNCSIFCFVTGSSCLPCNQYIGQLPPGYEPDDCGPRPTDAFVKSWSTSNYVYIEPPFPDLPPESIAPLQSHRPVNNDLNPVEDALYVCYNVYHGFCERLQLTNISNAIPWKRRSSSMDSYPKRTSDIPISVVNWDTTLFSTLTIDGSYVYVAIEQDHFQYINLVSLDPISVRLRDFDYASKEPGVKSTLYFNENYIRITYKFSFQYTLEQEQKKSSSDQATPYIYFVAQQPNQTDPGMLHTRISRICSGDTFLHSYVDMELSCDGCFADTRGNAHMRFGALHLATRGTVGREAAMTRFRRLANASSRVVPRWRQPIIFSEDFNNVLLVAFAPQLVDQRDYGPPAWNSAYETKMRPMARGTAIAFYTMTEIDVWFGVIIQNCLTGKTSTGPPHFVRDFPSKCRPDKILLPHLSLNQYCPAHPSNWPISGSLQAERLGATPILQLDVNVTGIAVFRVADNFTVLVVTTDEGGIIKYAVEEEETEGGGLKARRISGRYLTPRRRPLRGLAVDDSGLVAFPISDEKVFRVELQNCSSQESCGACLSQRDPHCGWCLSGGVCTHKEACAAGWVSYRQSPSSCPRITSLDPQGMDASRKLDPIPRTRSLNLRPTPDLITALTTRLSTTSHRERKRLLCVFRERTNQTSVEHPHAWQRRGPAFAQTEAFLPLGWSNDIICNLPEPSKLRSLKFPEAVLSTTVWLELVDASSGISTTTTDFAGHPLASGDFLVYDCHRFTDCQTCLSSSFECIWHLSDGQCLSITDAVSDSTSACTKSNCTCPNFTVDPVVTTVDTFKPTTVIAKITAFNVSGGRFLCSENCTGRWFEGIYDSLSGTVNCSFSGISPDDVLKTTLDESSSLSPLDSWHPDLLAQADRGLVHCQVEINWLNNRRSNQSQHGYRLVNTAEAYLEFFDCSRMAQHCDTCLALPSRFSCVWCPTSGDGATCLRSDRCLVPPSARSCPVPRLFRIIPENATLGGQTVLTLRGVNLGTDPANIQIRAVSQDASMMPFDCQVLPRDFRPSRQVTCRLVSRNLNTSAHLEAPLKTRIEVRLLGEESQVDSIPFTFFTPKIEGFSPKKGPISGGTLLRIFGQDLNIGGSIEVLLALEVNGGHQSAACHIVEMSRDSVVCQTQALKPGLLEPYDSDFKTGLRAYVALLHDKDLTRAPPQPFVFMADPVVRSVATGLLFFSGGTSVRVFGQNLDVIEDPRIVFYHQGMQFVESCKSTLGHLSCVSPSLGALSRNKREINASPGGRPIASPLIASKIESFLQEDEENEDDGRGTINVPYGFIMDNVTDLLVHGALSVFPDPEVFPFVDGRLVESFSSQTTTTKGSKDSQEESPDPDAPTQSSQDRYLLRFHGNFEALMDVPDTQALEELTIILLEDDSTDEAATRPCKPTVLKVDEIRCEVDRNGLVEGQDYPVLIRFGRNVESQPGVVQWRRLGALGGRESAVVVAACLVGVFALTASLFLALWCRARRTERHLAQKFQLRWAQQEKSVARAFKNDFIELQTHVEELVQDLNKTSLPIRDYRTYCLFSLFPEYHQSLVRPVDPHAMPPPAPASISGPTAAPDVYGDVSNRPHPLVSPFEVPANVVDVADRGISLFNHLLHNQHFLRLLAHTIEADRDIDAKSKSQVASLLSIILHSDMEYFTQTNLMLITDLLRKSRDHGGDSRLLTAFRRAESVAAKMLSNWLTFLLYNFIRERAAEHLFILYRALRQQINMGPRDAVTGLARYTLDAGTLLKSDLPSRSLTLVVIDPDGIFGQLCQPELPVRVLSCDTITQTKEKILDAIYRNTPYKNQLRPTDIHLKKVAKAYGNESDLFMLDWDLDLRRDSPNDTLDGPPYRLNCISDYKMNDNDVVSLVRVRAPQMPQTPLPPTNSNGLASLIAGPGSNRSTLTSRSHSKPGPESYSSLNGHIAARPVFIYPHQQKINIHPTGGPNPDIWYHLERPSGNGERGAGDRSSRQRGDEKADDFTSRSHRWLCCHRHKSTATTAKEHSVTPQALPLLPSPSSHPYDPGFGGLDARSLCQWLSADTSALSTATGGRNGKPVGMTTVERTRSINGSKRGRRRRRGRRLEVDLGGSGVENPDDAIDRPMTKFPCEIFLNRLLKTRVSVARYMDQVVELIFGSVTDSQSPPLCIKYLFDFLDLQAQSLGINDPGVLHAWKANCLHLRFWNQIIINLDYVFDIPLLRNTALERSFHSFSQAITYACSPVLDKVTIHSPINKALFSSDIEQHWRRVKKYFAEIKAMPPISPRDMNVSLAQHSQNHKNEFNISWALFELYSRHVVPCYETLITKLQAAVESSSAVLRVSYNPMGGGINSEEGVAYHHHPHHPHPPNEVESESLQMLQTLREVHSCLTAVAFAMDAGETNTHRSNGSDANRYTLRRQPRSLPPPPPPTERRLPPLPDNLP